jgi:hypothetical protein
VSACDISDQQFQHVERLKQKDMTEPTEFEKMMIRTVAMTAVGDRQSMGWEGVTSIRGHLAHSKKV